MKAAEGSAAKPWQRGIALATLKAYGDAFDRWLKPISFGAFGIPNERDVAAALADGQLVWTRELDGLAIARVTASASSHEDFAGNRIRIAAGSVLVRSLAGSPAGIARVLDGILAKAGGRPVWAEAFEELPGARAALEARGFRWIAAKVAASSEVKGLYARGAIASAPLEPAELVSLACLRSAFLSPEDLAAVRGELAAFGNRWQQHYSSYNKRKAWTAFALRGYGGAAMIEKPAEMSKAWKAANPAALGALCCDTEAAAAFPGTLRLLERIPTADFQRIRFMRLAPGGGELTRHADITDPEAGPRDGRICRLHIPIQTAAACRFRSWTLRGEEGSAHFPEASLCYLDTRKPHAVRNGSSRDRIHLVVDCRGSAELRRLIAAGKLL